jgi:hypothetical protein
MIPAEAELQKDAANSKQHSNHVVAHDKGLSIKNGGNISSRRVTPQ